MSWKNLFFTFLEEDVSKMFQVLTHLPRGTATMTVPAVITAKPLNIFGGDTALTVVYAMEDLGMRDLRENSSFCASLNY